MNRALMLLAMLATFCFLAESADFPVRRVCVYRNGVGEVTREAELDGDTRVGFSLPPNCLNDFLASFRWDDPAGSLRQVSWSHVSPLDILRQFTTVEIGPDGSRDKLLAILSGIPVRLETAGGLTLEGRLSGVRGPVTERPGRPTTCVALAAEDGTLREIPLETVTGLQGNREVTSDDNGDALFQGLPPGTYRIRAELQCFVPLEVANVPVRPGMETSGTLSLHVGEMSEQVTICCMAEPIRMDFDPAECRALGEVFSCRLPGGVTLSPGESLLAPVLEGTLSLLKGSYYFVYPMTFSEVLACKEPRTVALAARLSNGTGAVLEEGVCGVCGPEGFLGETFLPRMVPGASEVLLYGIDPEMAVQEKRQESREKVEIAGIGAETVDLRVRMATELRLAVRNASDASKTLLLEVGADDGMELREKECVLEKTPNAVFLKLAVPPNGETVFTFHFRRMETESLKLEDFSTDGPWKDADVSQLPSDDRTLLLRLAEIHGRQGELDAESGRLEKRRGAALDLESRVRANLEALGGSPSEEALRREYVRILNTDEDGFEILWKQEQTLRDERDRLAAEEERVRGRLAALAGERGRTPHGK